MRKWCRQNKIAAVGITVLCLLAAVALVGPLLSPYTYAGIDVTQKNQPGSWSHLFGADKLGRDIFVRVCYGTQISLAIGLGSTLINGSIGLLYGGLAGYLGGRVDLVMMRLADVISAVPSLLYVILINLVLGANAGSILVGICIAGWISTARIVRGEILRLKEREYLDAARLSGVPQRTIFFQYLLPETAGPVIVNLTFLIPQAIFTEAFLSFVGIGIAAPMASLGTLIQDARGWMQLYPAQMIWPLAVLCLLVVSVSLIGVDLERMVKNRKGE